MRSVTKGVNERDIFDITCFQSATKDLHATPSVTLQKGFKKPFLRNEVFYSLIYGDYQFLQHAAVNYPENLHFCVFSLILHISP